MRPVRRAVILVVLLLLLVSAGSVVDANPLAIEVTRQVILSGGGSVGAGDLAMRTTIGQAVTGTDSLSIYRFYLPLMLRNY